MTGVARARISPGSREFVAIIALCMAMAAISTDFMLPAFPEIRDEFNLASDSTEVSLLVTAFFLGLAVGQVVYGPLSDRWGRKPLLYTGLAIYTVGGVASTFAPTLGALGAFRFVWGFGAAAPRSLALAMVRDSFEGDRMASVMAKIMAVFILVPVFAPSLAAVALTFAPWRIVFWIPVVGAVLVSTWLVRLPETLGPVDRRSVGPASLGRAFKVVVTTRETVAFGLAITMLFGVLFSYISGVQTIIETVYDQEELFPVLFGLIASVLGVASFASGRLVERFGLARVIRGGAVYFVATAALLASVALATGGEPPLWAFCVLVAVLLPSVAVLVPTCNTAAMGPVPHVAGMAAAALGTISTGGGALLGSIVDNAFDGTITPFAVGALAYAAVSATAILVLAGRPRPPAAVDASTAAPPLE